MFYLIETQEQLNQLVLHNYKEAFIEIIPSSYDIHPALNNVSLIYLRPCEINKGFFICIDHSESLKISQNLAEKALKTYTKLYTINKKELLHYIPLKSSWDINISFKEYERPLTQTHKIFYKQYPERTDINKIIPIVKHYEMCEQIFSDFQSNIKEKYTKYEQFFNERTSIIFNAIERKGIQIDLQLFSQYFYETEQNLIYTQYNIKTVTSRPSNHFNGVNYAALNKKNGCKRSFIAKNSYLLEMDVSAMHPSIIAGLIKYTFDTTDIHQHFAELYNVSYDEAKQITFRQLYGGIYEQYKHLEFFTKTDQYIQKLWEKFKSNGYIKVPISGHIIRQEDVGEITPQKLFNLFIQATETAINCIIGWEILRLLRNHKTELIHTVYDSYLFDIDDEEEHLIEQIQSIFHKYGFNIKQKQGPNYKFEHISKSV
jgi:hypothetical protein